MNRKRKSKVQQMRSFVIGGHRTMTVLDEEEDEDDEGIIIPNDKCRPRLLPAWHGR